MARLRSTPSPVDERSSQHARAEAADARCRSRDNRGHVRDRDTGAQIGAQGDAIGATGPLARRAGRRQPSKRREYRSLVGAGVDATAQSAPAWERDQDPQQRLRAEDFDLTLASR